MQVYSDLAMALREGKEPCVVPLAMVAEWTADFSDERVVGEGAFGKVYEGVVACEAARALKLGALAVKLLSPDMIPEGGERHLKREIGVLRYSMLASR